MKKTLSLILVAIIALTSCMSLAGCTDGDDDIYRVGICQLTQHAALDQATKGFMDALKAELGVYRIIGISAIKMLRIILLVDNLVSIKGPVFLTKFILIVSLHNFFRVFNDLS